MTTTELVPFNGTSVRTIEHEHQTVVYMPDVALGLGLRPDNVIRGLDPWDFVQVRDFPSDLRGTSGGQPSPYWLTESGVWHLTYKQSPELRRKVNEELLPALRKTGRYSTTTQSLVERKLGMTTRQYGTWCRQTSLLDPKTQQYIAGVLWMDDKPEPTVQQAPLAPEPTVPPPPPYNKVPGSPSLYTGTKGQDSNDQHQ